MDEHPTEDQQAGEADRTEKVSMASSLPAPQGLAVAGHLWRQSNGLLEKAVFSARHLLLLWGWILGEVAAKSISLLEALSEGIGGFSTKGLLPEGQGGRQQYLSEGSPSAADPVWLGNLPWGGLG